MDIAEELKKIVINGQIEELVFIRKIIDDKILRLEMNLRRTEGILPVDGSVLFEAENLLNSQPTFSEKPVTVKLNPIGPSESDLLLESFGS